MQTKLNRESTTEEGIIDNSLLKVDVTKELGRGGFGVVYKGKYRGKDAAIKELLVKDFSPAAQQEFESESKIMLQLRDPSVVHLYGVTREKPYRMVLEFCSLGSLDRYLQKRKVEEVSWDVRFHLSTGIASGLQYLHSYNPIIIHGDLKSLNVLLTGDPLKPDTKIADFGLSKLKTETQSKSKMSSADKGLSIQWAAPELFSLSPKKTPASDLYAFGVTLWEIANHDYPYRNVTVDMIQVLIKSGERAELPENAPPLFAKVMTDCWSQKPSDRPSAKVALEQLQTYQETDEVDDVKSSFGSTSTTLSGGLLQSSSTSSDSTRSPVVSQFLNSSNSSVASGRGFSSRSSDNTASSSMKNSTTNMNSSPFNSGTSRFASESRVASSPLSSTSSSAAEVNSSPFNSAVNRFSTTHPVTSSSSTKVPLGSSPATPVHSRTSSGNNVSASTEDKVKTGFFQAAKMGDQSKLSTYKELLDEGLFTRDREGNTALHHAAANGHLEIVTWLVKEEEMNASERNQAEETPLLLAAQNGKQSVVEWLIQSGDVDEGERTSQGASALLLAGQQGHLGLVAWLLEKGVSKLTEKDKQQNTVFSSAKEIVVLWAALYRDLLQTPDPATSDSFDKIQAYQEENTEFLRFTTMKTLLHFGAKQLLKSRQVMLKTWWSKFTDAEKSALSNLATPKQLEAFLPQIVQLASIQKSQPTSQSSALMTNVSDSSAELIASPLTSMDVRRSSPLSSTASSSTATHNSALYSSSVNSKVSDKSREEKEKLTELEKKIKLQEMKLEIEKLKSKIGTKKELQNPNIYANNPLQVEKEKINEPFESTSGVSEATTNDLVPSTMSTATASRATIPMGVKRSLPPSPMTSITTKTKVFPSTTQSSGAGNVPRTTTIGTGSASESAILDSSLIQIDLNKKLGQGGFGVVYYGKYRGQEVAVKELLVHELSPSIQHEFEWEAKMMLSLRDPSVVHLFGVTVEKPYRMILEFCELGSLDKYLHQRQISEVSWDLRFHLATGIASGLHYLHTYNPIIIHGDLKSLNVLLTGNPDRPKTKLADFGMAQLKTRTQTQTVGMGSEGLTILWAAPELFSLKARKTTASDMYAYGITLWEIAAHAYPYANVELTFAIGAIKSGEREDIPENTPPLFAKVITDCWSQNAVDRPSAKVVLDQLQTHESASEVKPTSTNKLSASSLKGSSTKPSHLSASKSEAASDTEIPGKAEYIEGIELYRKLKYEDALVCFVGSAQKRYPAAYLYLGLIWKNGEGGVPKDTAKGESWYQQVAKNIDWFQKEAEKGDPEIQNSLGYCYGNGIGVPKDEKMAVKYYQLAANKKHPYGQANLGACYQYGKGVEKNQEMAAKYYQLAAGQGDALGQYFLGSCYQDGEGVTKDLKQAVKYFQLAADQGDRSSQLSLGTYYYEGNEAVERDYNQAVKYFQLAADQGYEYAQFWLGICYRDGEGVTEDLKQAVKYFQLAADQGNQVSQFILGRYYYEGNEAVDQDYSQAMKYFQLAADQGYENAQFWLGVCYRDGEGVDRDYKKAVRYFQLAADRGNKGAQYELGVCYENANGVEKDPIQAVKYYQLAADQGDMSAQFNLGWCFYNGEGVAKDLVQAVKYYQLAADQGHMIAQVNLAVCYADEGINQDYKQAVKYYQLASDQGNENAQCHLGVIYYSGKGGIKQDYAQARAYFQLAADQGGAEAQNYLGLCYLEHGGKTDKDYLQALKYFQLSANQGHESARNNLRIAQCNLGYYYFSGKEGVNQDYKQAVKCFQLAADQGDKDAQFYLGRCYKKAWGVTKDLVQAGKYYQLAANQGHADAAKKLEELLKRHPKLKYQIQSTPNTPFFSSPGSSSSSSTSSSSYSTPGKKF